MCALRARRMLPAAGRPKLCVRLCRWGYATPQEFHNDMRQIFDNCRAFNAPDQEVVVMGNTLEVCSACSQPLVQRRRYRLTVHAAAVQI